MKTSDMYLGLELGSTRIKAVGIDGAHRPVASGGYTWKSAFENGVWTYALEDAWQGIRAAVADMEKRDGIAGMGISAMMHGYLAFDKDWNLLTPFRTWQNTMTGEAAEKLTELFQFNIPQRWSIAHLYQAVLNNEAHVDAIAHLTTLAGYIHFMLTGVNAVGIGEASGMFPVDDKTLTYDAGMLDAFDALVSQRGIAWSIRDLLPRVLVAGENAGYLTEEGAKRLNGLLPPGIPFAPPEGDAGTGMVATDAIAERSGNVSAGTSIFAMVVLEKPLGRHYPEIDIVTTPEGKPVAMVHCNNCTNDMNAWVNVLEEAVNLFGAHPQKGELFEKLYNISLEGDADAGGLVVYNYMAGEGVTHMDEGRPMVIRRPDSNFSLANFIRAQLYATMATLRIGMDILASEHVVIDRLMGHGGLFKTPGVAQKYMAAACKAPVTCMETAGEGGPFGMAVLAAYMCNRGEQETLDEYLNSRVFASAKAVTIAPEHETAEGFERYLNAFKRGLRVEKSAVIEL